MTIENESPATAAVVQDIKHNPHSSPSNYTCPLPVWAIQWNKHDYQFDGGILRQSTVAVGAREEWPVCYFGHHTEESAKFYAVEDFTDAAGIVDHMNAILKSMWDELLELNEYELQKLIIIMFKRFGFWTDIVSPMEQIQVNAHAPHNRNVIPPPRKPKGRGKRKHLIQREVQRAEQRGENCDRQESKPVSKPAQVQPKTNPNAIYHAEDQNEHKVNSVKSAGVQREQQKQKQLEQQMVDEADEYLQSIVGDLVDNGICGSPTKDKPAKNVGKCVPAKFVRTVCQQLQNRYSIKPVTVVASRKGNKIVAENIYIDGEKVNSRQADKIRKFVSRQVKRHMAAQTGKPK